MRAALMYIKTCISFIYSDGFETHRYKFAVISFFISLQSRAVFYPLKILYRELKFLFAVLQLTIYPYHQYDNYIAGYLKKPGLLFSSTIIFQIYYNTNKKNAQ
jgi:hypothetical protein